MQIQLQPSNQKYSYCVRLVFDLRNLLHLHENGDLHAAEHMLFVGTEKLSMHELQLLLTKYFYQIEAVTYYDRVEITFSGHIHYYQKGSKLVQEMIQGWKIDPSLYDAEYRHLWQELSEKTKELSRSWFFAVRRKQDISYKQVVGTLDHLAKFSDAYIEHLRSVWAELLREAPLAIVGFFPAEFKEQTEDQLVRTFTGKNLKPRAGGREQVVDLSTGVGGQQVFVLMMSGIEKVSFRHLLLQIIFYWRSLRYGDRREAVIEREFDRIYFGLITEEKLSAEAISTHFSLSVNKEEFDFAKSELLRHLEKLIDGVDLFEIADWMQRLCLDGEFTGKMLQDIHRMLREYSHSDFTAELSQFLV